MNSTIPVFRFTKYFLSTPQLIQVFNVFVFSKYNYGIEIYGKCSKPLMAKLQSTQNRLLKIMLSKNKRTSTNEIHKTTKLLKIEDSTFLRQSLIVHDIIHHTSNIPASIRLNIHTQSAIHSKNTRGAVNISLSAMQYRKNNKVMDTACINWNCLHNSIKAIASRNTFKEKTKTTFLEKYLD